MTSLNSWGIKITLKFCIQQKYPSKIEDEMENIFSFVLFLKAEVFVTSRLALQEVLKVIESEEK